MATDLEIQFELKVQELLDLRQRRLAGEILTTAQYAELGLYRELLSEYVQTQRIQNRKISLAAAKEEIATIRDLQQASTDRLVAGFAKQAQLFEATFGEIVQPVVEVAAPVPQKPTETVEQFDPSNPNKTIRDLLTAGTSVEDGTKSQEFSKQEGIFNEYSFSTTFIETIKNTIAQEVDRSLVVAVAPTATLINQETGATIQVIESIKSDVAQLLQEGEIQIERNVQLGIFGSAVYNDPETAIRATSIKQDSLDPTVQLIATATNPYNITGAALNILQNNLALEADALETAAELAITIAQAEQQQLQQEQAAAVESFTGGG